MNLNLRWNSTQLARVRKVLACRRCFTQAEPGAWKGPGAPSHLAIYKAARCTNRLRELLTAGYEWAVKIPNRGS